MRKLLSGLTFFILLVSAQAQQRPQGSQEPEVYFDDDGGRVFLVRRDSGPVEEFRHHGGAVLLQPRQVNIFLGSAWAKEKYRAQQTTFADLLMTLNSAAEKAPLSRFAVSGELLPAISRQELMEFPKHTTLNDLDIQSRLAEMFQSDPTTGPEADTVYMVFLAPKISSMVGQLTGRKYYLAYHNYVHVGGLQVHYVVMPYEGDAEQARAIARRALLEAVINPAGSGWY